MHAMCTALAGEFIYASAQNQKQDLRPFTEKESRLETFKQPRSSGLFLIN